MVSVTKKYPFKEGDTYYTVENGLLVCSCWDDTSEELYDADPEKVYYCVNKSGLIEWVPQSGGNKKLCSFPPELYLRRAQTADHGYIKTPFVYIERKIKKNIFL